MPSKKKKFNARFPPARIKKIMQTDEDVGKVAAPVPVIISRALELFIESLIVKSSNITKSRHAKTLSTAHIKHTILSEKRFDFLKDLVANIADVQTEDDGLETTATVSGRSTEMEPRRRVRGRPRKKKADVKLALKSHLKRQKRLDEDPDTEETDTATEEPASDDVDDDEDDEEDGDTETDPDVHDNPNITDSSSVKYISDNSSEPKASCSKMDVNAYPKSEAHSGPDAQQPNQQVCSLDLRMNQNKPDMIGRSESTAHGSTTHAIVTCQGLTHPGGIGLGQYPHLAASSSGVMNCWPGGWSELIAQPHTTVLAQSDIKPSTGENPGQSNNRSSSVSQQGASPNAEKAGNNNQFNRPSGNQNSEVAPKSDSLGNVISTQENMFPMYGAGMPATSMPFYPHPVGVVQQMAPYPAHMRPMQGMMPSYQAVPHASHMMMPQVIDLRYGLPNMNSTPVPAVQSVYSESARTDQPPPAHSKHNTPQQHVDKTEHTAS